MRGSFDDSLVVLTTVCSADYDHTVAGPASIDRNYVRPDPLPLFPISSPFLQDAIIAKETSGRFNSSGTIMLSHELDAWTMGESQKYLPRLQAAFEAVVPGESRT